MDDLIPMYQSENILARSINWNACSWTTPQEVFDSMRQSFQANKAKQSTMLVINRSLVVRNATNGGSI